MKIASLVPSWTETLIACEANVVARTRYCIHPHDKIKRIPAVGGTKQIDWAKLASSGAEYLILDRDENPKAIADQSPIPFVASDIHSINDVPHALEDFAKVFSENAPNVAVNLRRLKARWEKVCASASGASRPAPRWIDLPGVMEWWREPKNGLESIVKGEMEIVYVIWKDPWMVAAPQTFIGSMISAVGFGGFHRKEAALYPELDLESLDPEKTVLLLSSEPFPFAKKREGTEPLVSQFPCAVIDGEPFSWFGLRSLEFLENLRF